MNSSEKSIEYLVDQLSLFLEYSCSDNGIR